jgi:hypothetical protein
MTPTNPPPQLPRCELCGGQQIGNLGMVSQSHVGIHPNARQVWSRPLSRLSAVVCLGCGHTKFFAAEIARIREEATEHAERFHW